MTDEPIFSPDGQHMWTGSEWIPAPPASDTGSVNISDSIVMGDVNSVNNFLQRDPLEEIRNLAELYMIQLKGGDYSVAESIYFEAKKVDVKHATDIFEIEYGARICRIHNDFVEAEMRTILDMSLGKDFRTIDLIRCVTNVFHSSGPSIAKLQKILASNEVEDIQDSSGINLAQKEAWRIGAMLQIIGIKITLLAEFFNFHESFQDDYGSLTANAELLISEGFRTCNLAIVQSEKVTGPNPFERIEPEIHRLLETHIELKKSYDERLIDEDERLIEDLSKDDEPRAADPTIMTVVRQQIPDDSFNWTSIIILTAGVVLAVLLF